MNMFLFMSGLGPVLLSFPVERAVFLREAGSNMYSVLPYYIAKQIVDIPMVLIVPTISTYMIYDQIGFNRTTEDNFYIFLGASIIHHLVGISLGLFGGCVFSNMKVA